MKEERVTMKITKKTINSIILVTFMNLATNQSGQIGSAEDTKNNKTKAQES